MKILVINSGSSSIKYQLFEMSDGNVVANGALERIGEKEGRLNHRVRGARGALIGEARALVVANHREGLETIFGLLTDPARGVLRDTAELYAVGHRVVHGGEAFREPTFIDDQVIATIESYNSLAPLHNPANVLGIRAVRALFPHLPQVAVFDTAFHQTMPAHAFHYALPRAYYTMHHVRRYGFHGTSHGYVARQAAHFLGKPLSQTNLISLHLGNGASATAIENGRSIDTSMGLTPLEGLVMGTRCGDLDPAIPFYLARVGNLAPTQLETLLNQESGLKGICGVNDMREVLRRVETNEDGAELALSMYCYRIRKYIGAYLAVLGKLDALIFTAGIGENSPIIRSRCCTGLTRLGLEMDEELNRAPRPANDIAEIQSVRAETKILVIPTNEELAIALQTRDRVQELK